MHYQHGDIHGKPIHLPLGKVVCVGRNYTEHAEELGNEVPTEPVLFIKPATALVPFEHAINASSAPHQLHYELEIAILISDICKNVNNVQAKAAIGGVGLALDLTYRSVQSELKKKRLPWEKAKAFDNSCPVSTFNMTPPQDISQLEMRLSINEELKQFGKARDMVFDVESLIEYSSQHFTFMPGDILLTGTPAGVGSLAVGDKLRAELCGHIDIQTSVI